MSGGVNVQSGVNLEGRGMDSWSSVIESDACSANAGLLSVRVYEASCRRQAGADRRCFPSPVHEVVASIPGRSAFGQQPWASCSHAYASAVNSYT